MALATPALASGIKALFDTMRTMTSGGDDFFADQLSSLLETWVMTGTVTTAAGIPVATTGSPTAQTGATTGPGTGTIS